MNSCSRCDLKRSVCLCLFAQLLFVLGLTTSGQSQNPVTTSTRALVHSKGGETFSGARSTIEGSISAPHLPQCSC